MAKIPADILAVYQGDIDLTGIGNFNSSFTKESFDLLIHYAIRIGLKAHSNLKNTQNKNLKSFAYFMDLLFGLENSFRFLQ